MEEQVKSVLCKHCNISYPATKDNFYTCKSKLKFDICKNCKKERSRLNEKNRKPRDRREYTKMYYARKKLQKQALEDSKDN